VESLYKILPKNERLIEPKFVKNLKQKEVSYPIKHIHHIHFNYHPFSFIGSIGMYYLLNQNYFVNCLSFLCKPA
jgi:hypothetical protein